MGLREHIGKARGEASVVRPRGGGPGKPCGGWGGKAQLTCILKKGQRALVANLFCFSFQINACFMPIPMDSVFFPLGTSETLPLLVAIGEPGSDKASGRGDLRMPPLSGGG